jgi:hypothetical protein
MSDYRRGLDWWLDFLTIYTHDLLSASNYSSTADLHNSQITTAPAKPFSSLLYSHQPFPVNGF